MKALSIAAGGRRDLPVTTLLLSLSALAVPSLAALGSPAWMEETSAILIWMTPLLPAFLLAYYRGWAGAALALATGMASLAVAQVIFLVGGVDPPDWPQLLGVVGVYLLFALGIGTMAEILRRERDAAMELALVDPLTGLSNRRHAELFLESAFARAERGSLLSVAVFDLDRFKALNDRWGHATGDRILAEFGGTLKGFTRRSDLSARVGGEEFLTVLSHSDLEGAQIFAERVREKLQSKEFACGPVTVSGGVAVFEKGMGSPDVLLAAADRALYQAKLDGRNRIVVASVSSSTRQAQSGEKMIRAPASSPGNLRVAVVEDDPSVANALGKMIRRLGYDATVFLDPRDFLGGVESGRANPDLLLTDLVMPGMNGLTLVEEVGRRGFDSPVVFMSGYVQGEVTWPGIPGGVSAFLEKPIDPQTLSTTLSEILGGKA